MSAQRQASHGALEKPMSNNSFKPVLSRGTTSGQRMTGSSTLSSPYFHLSVYRTAAHILQVRSDAMGREGRRGLGTDDRRYAHFLQRHSHSRLQRVRFARSLVLCTNVLDSRPNLEAQSNMTPERAAELWKANIQPLKASHNLTLVSPVPTNGPTGTAWLQNFTAACGPECTIDKIALRTLSRNRTSQWLTL